MSRVLDEARGNEGLGGFARQLRRAAALVLLGVCPALAAGPGANRASGPAQAVAAPLRIPLEAMGYEPLSQDFLLAGSSMLTVDFVDKDHLLVSFGVRRLMRRDPNDPPGDDDRTVGAFLVELPSGRVLAQTEWRLHDRLQYLWNLGNGRFLLRVRDRLSLIAPLEAVDANEAFRPKPLLRLDRHIVAILVSPNSDLLTVETTKWAMSTGDEAGGFSLDPAPVQINFYRMSEDGDGLVLSSAGTIRTRMAVSLPMTTAGRLEVLDGGKNRWLFNFDEHAGKVDELAGFDSSCFPHPMFVGQGEFIAFGCRGGADKTDLAGFNLRGDFMWQQNFFDSQVSPTFSFAPAAGRFALGRTIVSGDFDPEMPLAASVVTGQEVRVYQTYSGRMLLKTELSPIERAGQNFALSPDGMRLAVVRESLVRHPATQDNPAYTDNEAGVEVYQLPPLTAEDRAAVTEAQKMGPADAGERIDLALLRAQAAGVKEATDGQGEKMVVKDPVLAASSALAVTDAEGSPAAPATAGEAEAAQAASAQPEADPVGAATVMEGDVQPVGPRQRPTLYAPDEKPGSKQ